MKSVSNEVITVIGSQFSTKDWMYVRTGDVHSGKLFDVKSVANNGTINIYEATHVSGKNSSIKAYLAYSSICGIIAWGYKSNDLPLYSEIDRALDRLEIHNESGESIGLIDFSNISINDLAEDYKLYKSIDKLMTYEGYMGDKLIKLSVNWSKVISMNIHKEDATKGLIVIQVNGNKPIRKVRRKSVI